MSSRDTSILGESVLPDMNKKNLLKEMACGLTIVILTDGGEEIKHWLEGRLTLDSYIGEAVAARSASGG
jgi:hypothetical protein